jgi:hypothetical protein
MIATADSTCPSIVTQNRLFKQGRWYYEVTIVEDCDIMPRVGWACPSFTGNESKNHGLGDDQWSWAIDGSTQTKRHKGQGTIHTEMSSKLAPGIVLLIICHNHMFITQM